MRYYSGKYGWQLGPVVYRDDGCKRVGFLLWGSRSLWIRLDGKWNLHCLIMYCGKDQTYSFGKNTYNGGFGWWGW